MEFSADLLPYVQQFNCGPDVWCKDVNAFLKDSSGECALTRLTHPKYPAKTWVYSSEQKLTAKTLVGYSSLGLNRWPFNEGKEKIGLIPFFGIDTNFRKKYHEGTESFAKGVFKDLLFLANDPQILDPDVRHLGLFVDPANTDGVKFWVRRGFDNHPSKTYTDRESGVTFQGMYLRFKDGPVL